MTQNLADQTRAAIGEHVQRLSKLYSQAKSTGDAVRIAEATAALDNYVAAEASMMISVVNESFASAIQ